MLEDDKTIDLRNKANSNPLGYLALSKDELFYLFSHSAFPQEQETIKSVLGLKFQEELVKETKKLTKSTWCVAIATWFVAAMTALLVYISK